MIDKLQLWKEFCDRFRIIESEVPLFQVINGCVEVFEYGSTKRSILRRSKQMDQLVINEVDKVIKDYNEHTDVYDGLIYMMFWKENGTVVPLYIGKSEKYGRKNGNLSENIKNIKNNNSKFCRWGYNYAYHTGDLSAVVCEGHPEDKKTIKYTKWAETIFELFTDTSPILKKPIYFWMTAWNKNDVGPWIEFGQTSLTFLEYLLIGLASDVFPEVLLNDEGVNRK